MRENWNEAVLVVIIMLREFGVEIELDDEIDKGTCLLLALSLNENKLSHSSSNIYLL